MLDITNDHTIPIISQISSILANCQTKCMEIFMSMVMVAWSVVMMLPVGYKDPCAIRFNEITNVIPAWFLLIILDILPLRRFTAFWSMLYWLFVTGLYWHQGFIFPDLAVFPLYAISCGIVYLKLGSTIRVANVRSLMKMENGIERSKHNSG